MADETEKQEEPLGVLYFRRKFCQECIRIVDHTDDPRRKEALEIYKAQLARIDARIAALTGKPPAVVVGLKTARLFGDSKLGG